MANRENINDCIGLGFYSVVAKSDCVTSFYHDLVGWFNAVGHPPDKLSVHGVGFGGKPNEFAKIHARLTKQGFTDIKGFSVFAMLPNGKIPALDWSAIASLDLGVGLRPYFALAVRTSVATLESRSLAQLITSCISNLTPAYGIGFHRNHDQGPWFYAAGINYGSPIQETVIDYEESLTISRWSDLAMVEEVYKKGILRDIYPHNYLSVAQLERPIGRMTLRDWILANSTRGTLAKLPDSLTLWKVDVHQVEVIRDELWKASVIFNWKDYL